ncbi:hypothetical protein [Archangium sp.]|uniref:hypothetical protein n=1 Tax=Archangium sp. TaxID=1872627 RepID=UPI00389ADACC
MTRFTRLTILSAMTLGLVACGGAKLGGGKEGAAQAAFQASQPTGRGSKTGQSLVKQALASGAATLTLTANCADSGKVSLAFDATQTSTDGFINYTVTYDACNEDGQNEYTGTMATSIGFAFDPTTNSGSFIIGMKGKLTIDGDISDSLDANVKMTMDFAATSAHSGNVKLVLDGTITTSDGSYVYNNETIAIAAGELPKA